MSNKIGEARDFEYLMKDLIEDEAISSSQLEGAATTTVVAKSMLRNNRRPRTPDEKMILGNYKMMSYAWKGRYNPMSIGFIEEIHRIGVEGIDDERYVPGEFRNSDDISVVKVEEIVHTPPPAANLQDRLERLVTWINTSHDDTDRSDYLHPLIKAVAIHFAIGYEHPFRDGNGRVARALFYWFMFKSDYAAFRYIAISVLLNGAPLKYGKSYLYTETDEMDITYFIDYQCSVILKAVSAFSNTYKKSLKELEDFNTWLWESGLMSRLNQNQKMVFQVAKTRTADVFTATNVKENLGCSYNIASKVLNGLVKLNVFSKRKEGREWIFSMLDKQDIQTGWRS